MDANSSEIPNKKLKTENDDVDLVFRTELLDNLKSSYESKTMCNLTLIAGANGQRITAHRVVLAAASPFFRTIFAANDTNEKNQTELTLSEIDGLHLKMLIDFCYSGQIDVNETNVRGILAMAIRFQFKRIERKCQLFLSTNLSVSNCLLACTSTEEFLVSNETVQSAMQLAEQNFEAVVGQQEFLLLDDKHLLQLLQSNELNVWSEEEVFNALVKWINYDENARKSKVRILLSAVRFTHLKANFLYSVVKVFCMRFNCLDLIKDVYEWKLVPESQPNPFVRRTSTTAERFIAVGNCSPNNIRSSEMYEPAINNWKDFKQFSCNRNGFCTVLVKDELFILGGLCLIKKRATNIVQKYNFFTKTLTNMQPMIKAREWFSVALLNNTIFAAGGVNSESVEKFNIDTNMWTQLPPMLEKRRDFTLVSISGRLFAVGGLRESKKYLDSVECYDPLENKWKIKASMNRARCSHGAYVYKDRLYVVGGLPLTLEAEFYDSVIDKWIVISTLSIPRFGFGLAVATDEAILAGGRTTKDKTISSVIRIKLDSWDQVALPPMNVGRAYFGLIPMPQYNPND